MFLILLMAIGRLFAYSVLTHEEIVDLAWLTEIRPLLLQRFTDLTTDQIVEAHAYAYGGSVIQDLGYYPFGNKEFSNLVHYVRSGDFVLALLQQRQDADEYAFALGALSHYAPDIDGHPAVNQAVALHYPKLRAKFGRSGRYADDQTYANLLASLSANKFDLTSAGLRGNILDFYADLTLPIATRKDPARWQIVLTDLNQLQAAMPVLPIAAKPGLYRLRKTANFQAKSPKNIPQGLKLAFIFSY